jgi:hypothetical protein
MVIILEDLFCNPELFCRKTSKWYAWYFVSFLLFGIYFLLNFTFAEVFSTYRDFCRKDFKRKYLLRQFLLKTAFNILTNGEQFMTKRSFTAFITRLYPGVRPVVVSRVFSKLADIKQEKITLQKFLSVLDVIELEISSRDRRLITKLIYKISLLLQKSQYLTFFISLLRSIVDAVQSHFLYDWVLNLFLVTNCCVLWAGVYLKQTSSHEWISWNLFIFCGFVIECVLDIFSFKLFTSEGSVNGLTRFCVQVLYLLIGFSLGYSSRPALVMQGVLCFRLLAMSGMVRSTMTKLMESLPYLFINVLFVFLTMYIFNIVGMCIFSGLLVMVRSQVHSISKLEFTE